MRVAIVFPDRPRWPKFDWVARAVRNLGHEMLVCRDWLDVEMADDICDVIIFCHKGAGVDYRSVIDYSPQRKAIWCQWIFDLMAIDLDKPLAEQQLLRWFSKSSRGGVWENRDYLEMMKAMDVAFVKERGYLDDYRSLGANVEWLDQACPRDMAACIHPEEPEWDVLVWGSCGREWRERKEDVRFLLREGFAVAWAGLSGGGHPPSGVQPLPWCPPLDLPKLAGRAKAVLCVDYRHDINGYWSDRLWLALGMGACVLRRYTPGLPRELTSYAYTYKDHDGLRWAADMLSKRMSPTERSIMGERARRWTMGNHTYEHRVEELLCNLPKRASAERVAAPAA